MTVAKKPLPPLVHPPGSTLAERATGLFIICAEVLHDGDHQYYVEVVACRKNNGYTVWCEICGERRFLGRRSKWKRLAMTRADLERTTRYKGILPAAPA